MDNMIAYNGCLDCQGRGDPGPLPLRYPLRRWGVRKVLGRDWPHDAMRHSYASYHFAMYRDAGLTAKNLGHPSSTLLRKDLQQRGDPGRGGGILVNCTRGVRGGGLYAVC